MPISILEKQQRLRQLGEIRIGHTIKLEGTDRRGQQKTRPAKLNKFRFTSPSKPLLEKVAVLYGGTVKAWQPQNGGPAEWELFSDAASLPVLVPPQSTSQWFELYQGPKCVRRCDGVTEQKTDRKCLCDPRGALDWFDERECAVTTRLNVMLRDVPAIGLWLLTSHGKNAAVELPPMAQFLAATEGYVAGRLGIEERVTYPLDGPPNRFMVPHLEVDETPAALMPGGSGPRSLNGAPAKALEAGPKAIEGKAAPVAADDPGPEYWKAQADSAETLEALTTALLAAQSVDRAKEGDPLFLHFVARRKEIEESEVAVAEIVEDAAGPEDPALDELWFQITENAPSEWGTDRLAQEFARRTSGTLPVSASAGQLRAFLAQLKSGSAVAA